MPATRLKRYLDDHGTRYTTLLHSPAYTAQEVAAVSHVAGRDLAKVVIVKLDGALAMAVVPAPERVNMSALAALAQSQVAELASEDDFRETFEGCEVGAMPPFGNLWQVPVYVASTLAEDEEIAFAAGSHHELMKLSFKDFERLVGPTVADITFRRPRRVAV